MGNRYYLHGCPKEEWDKGIDFLPLECKQMAVDCLVDEMQEDDIALIEKPYRDPNKKFDLIKEHWVYYYTEKFSTGMQGVIEIYLESLAWSHYGSW